MCFRLTIAVLCGGFAICYRHPHLKVWTCVDYGMAVRGSRAFVWFGRLFDRKVFGIPTAPRSMDSHGFVATKVFFDFAAVWLFSYRFNGAHTSAIHDVHPSLSKQAQVTTTIWRLAGLNLNALWSGTLILLTLYVPIDISQRQLLTFLHHCDTRCLLPMFGTAAGAEATNDPCCLSFYLPLLDLFREVYDLGQVFRYGMFIMFILC